MKRVIDILISSIVMIIFAPVLAVCILFVFLEDFRNPIYAAVRVGYHGRKFRMYKIRSMRIGADKTGVESTSQNDPRITKVGKYIRKFKFDELSQFVNVLSGDMSIVGPRPNTVTEVDKYSNDERKLLESKPGITDISSIVFSNEGEILKLSSDPDADYEQLIRPWKSELALIYVNKNSLNLDMILILATAVSIFNRSLSLKIISNELKKMGVREELVKFSRQGLSS